MKKLIIFLLSIISSISIYSQSKGFYICLGSFNNKPKFVSYYKKLKSEGIKLVAEKVYDNDKVYYQMYYNHRYPTYFKAKAALPKFEKYRSALLFEGTDLWIKHGIIRPYDPFAGTISYFDDEFIYHFANNKYPYTVICEKLAGAVEINKTETLNKDFNLVQVTPAHGTLATGAPVIFFFNSDILLPSIIQNIQISNGDNIVKGTIRIFNYSEKQSAISIAISDSNFSGTVSIKINSNLSDSYGNKLDTDISSIYSFSSLSNENNKSEETLIINKFKYFGDGLTINYENPIIESSKGSAVLAISNSDQILTRNNSLDNKSSYTSALIDKIPDKIFFKYNFLSSEFNELNTNNYGDMALLVISGDNYQKSYVITSVKKVGDNNIKLPYRKFANLPDAGDSYAGKSGWNDFTADKIRLTGKATISFIVIDLVEPSQSSVLLIDKIDIKQ